MYYSVSVAVSSNDRRFVIHDPSQGAQIFDMGMLKLIPNAIIPYTGPRIVVPLLFGGDGPIVLTGDQGEVKVYSSTGEALGQLGIETGQ